MLPQTMNMVRHEQTLGSRFIDEPKQACTSRVGALGNVAEALPALQAVRHHPSLRCPSLTAA